MKPCGRNRSSWSRICAPPDYAVEYPLTPVKPDKQFKRAQELKTANVVQLENSDYVRIRDFKTRKEIVAGVADVANHL